MATTIEWPTSLPQSPLLEGYSDEPQDSVIRSEMTGLTKQRNRYTAILFDVTESYLMTPTQFNTFLTFYTSILGNGAADFLKNHPVSGTQQVYRMSGPYSMEFNGFNYKVELSMERKP